MTTHDDLAQVQAEDNANSAIMAYWAAAVCAYRTLKMEAKKLRKAEARMIDADAVIVPHTIIQHGAQILQKLEATITQLEAAHGEFLTWTGPE